MTDPIRQLADTILAIEAEMRSIGLWEGAAPPAQSLASSAPFCYDTLEFSQWLQWVFLPKVAALVESGQPWPARSDIAPLAEESFKQCSLPTDRLLVLLQRFDTLINDQP